MITRWRLACWCSGTGVWFSNWRRSVWSVAESFLDLWMKRVAGILGYLAAAENKWEKGKWGICWVQTASVSRWKEKMPKWLKQTASLLFIMTFCSFFKLIKQNNRAYSAGWSCRRSLWKCYFFLYLHHDWSVFCSRSVGFGSDFMTNVFVLDRFMT